MAVPQNSLLQDKTLKVFLFSQSPGLSGYFAYWNDDSREKPLGSITDNENVAKFGRVLCYANGNRKSVALLARPDMSYPRRSLPQSSHRQWSLPINASRRHVRSLEENHVIQFQNLEK